MSRGISYTVAITSVTKESILARLPIGGRTDVSPDHGEVANIHLCLTLREAFLGHGT